MKRTTSAFNTSLTIVGIASMLLSCEHVAKRCDIDRIEYPLQHTLPDGRSVELHRDAKQCGMDARGVWVRAEQDGESCGVGYGCQRRPRSGGGR